jgi:hypothetical protein
MFLNSSDFILTCYVFLFQNGLYSALPYIAFWMVINLAGWLADFCREKKFINTTMTRKTFDCFGKEIVWTLTTWIFIEHASYFLKNWHLECAKVNSTIANAGVVQSTYPSPINIKAGTILPVKINLQLISRLEIFYL